MYRALYRKYRPQVFSDVVGQEVITTALSNQILADKVGHAYLFTGTRGTGKTTCAKIFAKAVNCESRNGADPCGVCDICVGLENGSVLDVSEIDAASNNGVDDIRALRDETAYRPSRCRYRVYIIDEVHMLSTSAFNALLKIMEEPPGHVIFILATTEIHKVPATIVSRCQRYDFGRIAPEKIAQRLLEVAGQEDMQLTPAAADLIARLADGALRDALSLLDTCSGMADVVDEELVRRMAGVADKDYLFGISEAVKRGNSARLVELVASLRERSIDVKRLTEELIYHYRTLLLAVADADGALLTALPQAERERYMEAAKQTTQREAIEAMRRLAAAMDRMGRSVDPRIELEVALFDLSGNEPGNAPPVASAAPAARPQATSPAPQPAYAKPQAAQPAAPPPAQVEQAPTAAPEHAPTPPEPEVAVVPVQQPVTPPPARAAVPVEGEPVPFAYWPQVVEEMAGVDRMMYSYMKSSQAYTDGRRVLIDAGEMFRTYIKEKEAASLLKEIIERVSGARYGIGPYTSQSQQQEQAPKLEDTLKELAEQGVEIKYE